MRIIQINDLHLASHDPRNPSVDTFRQWQRVRTAIQDVPHDLLVISGDIADHPDGSVRFFSWLKKQSIRTELLLGNHDDPAEFSKHVKHSRLTWRSFETATHTLILLDTSTYHVDEAQRRWLQQMLQEAKRPVILFSHHPLIPCPGLIMDRLFPLSNQDELTEILLRHPHPVHVFSAHYHTEHEQKLGQITQYVTPAVFYQLKKYGEQLAVDHLTPAYRLIELGEEIQTSVHFVSEQ